MQIKYFKFIKIEKLHQFYLWNINISTKFIYIYIFKYQIYLFLIQNI